MNTSTEQYLSQIWTKQIERGKGVLTAWKKTETAKHRSFPLASLTIVFSPLCCPPTA